MRSENYFTIILGLKLKVSVGALLHTAQYDCSNTMIKKAKSNNPSGEGSALKAHYNFAVHELSRRYFISICYRGNACTLRDSLSVHGDPPIWYQKTCRTFGKP